MPNLLRRLIPVLLCAVIGCGAPEPGWNRLWESDWRSHGAGSTWVLGVEADGREVFVPENGIELRTTLFNLGPEPGEVILTGPKKENRWSLDPGEKMVLRERLRRGTFRFAGAPGMVLGSPRTGRPVAEPQLAVFILVDTLRDDHVNPELMPGVTGFFADGRRWDDAVANAPWTLPSVASVFASKPVLSLTSPEGEIIGLPEGTPTWATQLYKTGFEGGAVVANPTVHSLNGFAEGFSEYSLPETLDLGEAPDGSWVVDRARRWLAEHDGENAFLYLHLMDPHAPYRNHDVPGAEPPDLGPLADRSREATTDEAVELSGLYAGEVGHVDGILTPFLEDLPDSAAVVLTADHGEALGEHGAWSHGLNLYREALRVPLLVRGGTVSPGSESEPVQLLDLGPTVLDLVGVDPDEEMVGRSLLEGGSSEPMVSATFGSGPLRWAWQRGSDKVVLRTASQSGLGAESRARLREAKPLPAGVFHFDLDLDPGEDQRDDVSSELSAEVGAVFAETAGRMTPGLQLMLWNGDGPAKAVVELGGEAEVVQAWSTAPMTASWANGRFELRCADAGVLCAAALAADSVGGVVTPLSASPSWYGVEKGQGRNAETIERPAGVGGGFLLWWNPPRPLVVGGYEETVERLRALGYID